MQIVEVLNGQEIDMLLSVVASYQYSAEEMESIKKQLLKELGESGDNRVILRCMEDATCVAFIEIILKNADNDPELADGKEIAHLHHLRVRSELQGRGYGRAMTIFAEDWAKRLGKKTLTLGVDYDNERAIRLYEVLGYRTFRTVSGQNPGEQYFLMKKTL